jgi:hypothetical protein
MADAGLRAIERAVLSGDATEGDLRRERERLGFCPSHGLTLTGRVRRTCPACRAERKAELELERLVKAIADGVWQRRQDRAVHPEGTFDKAKRFYPSDREEADDVVGEVRSPSRAWPYSYMTRCRTRSHCRALVERGMRGLDTPPDVQSAIAWAADRRSGSTTPLIAVKATKGSTVHSVRAGALTSVCGRASWNNTRAIESSLTTTPTCKSCAKRTAKES